MAVYLQNHNQPGQEFQVLHRGVSHIVDKYLSINTLGSGQTDGVGNFGGRLQVRPIDHPMRQGSCFVGEFGHNSK